MKAPPADQSRGRRLLGLAAAALAVRLLSLPLYPLTDTTEARYALIARAMAQTGDWITPWFVDGVPFWGKPPLAFWATAGVFRLFGATEWAARLGTFIPAAAVVMGMALWAMHARGAIRGGLAAVVMASNLLLFVSCGSVLTDTWLMLATSLSMVGFWQALAGRRSGLYLACVGIGLGLLAKGPLTLVLVLPPLAATLAYSGQWRMAVRWPWLRGIALASVIAVPWYALAELKTPGFLEYFIVGEHWRRYVEPQWSGDLYGTAHLRPLGAIWLYALVSFLPWTLWLPWRLPALFELWRHAPQQRVWLCYLAAWALWPMLFFTFARNILPTYLLPAVPAWGLLFAEASGARLPAPWLRLSTAFVPTVLALAVVLYRFDSFALKSENELMSAAQGAPVQFVGKVPFSARWYGEASAAVEGAPSAYSYVALRRGRSRSARSAPAADWQLVAEDLRYRLYRVPE